MQIDPDKARASYRKLPSGAAYNAAAIVQDELLSATQHYMNAHHLFGRRETLTLRYLSWGWALCHVKRQMVQAA